MADASPSGDWTINNGRLLELRQAAGGGSQYDLVRLSSNKVVVTDANDSNELYGMALNDFSANEWVIVARDKATLTIASGGFTPDSDYFVSENAGKSAPLADISTSGAHKTRAFWAHSATQITLDIFKTGDTA